MFPVRSLAKIAASIKQPIPCLCFLAVMATFVLFCFRKPLATFIENVSGTYRVRIEVIGVDAIPTTDATVSCSIGEQKKTFAGFECDIPWSSMGADHTLKVSAENKDSFAKGQLEIELEGANPNILAKVFLQVSSGAHLRGIVKTSAGDPIPGASVITSENVRVQTTDVGTFDLETHRPTGQMIKVLVVKSGFETLSQLEQAGDDQVELVLTPHNAHK